MRSHRLLITPVVLLVASCTQVGDVYTIDPNSNAPGGSNNCKPGQLGQSVWTGTKWVGPCNDGPDIVEIAVPPTPVPPDPINDPPNTIPAVIDPVTGAISIPETTTPPDVAYLWVSNTSEGSVSKVDVKALKEVARYRSSRVCSNTSGDVAFDDADACNAFAANGVDPSRTAIDSESNAFVANRAFGLQATVTKFAATPSDCIDRNANGVIETSAGAAIVANDECTLYTVPVGGKKNNAVARALAIGPILPSVSAPDPDISDAVWVGLYNDKKAVRLRNFDGKTMETYSLNLNPYGAAIDPSNRAWFAGRGGAAIQYVRGPPCSGGGCVSPLFKIPAAIQKCAASTGPYPYGIAVDKRGRVYTQAGECNQTWQFTPDGGPAPTSGTWRKINLPAVRQGRGVAVQVWSEPFPDGPDGDTDPDPRDRNRVWVTNYDQWSWGAWTTSYATSFDGDKLACDRDLDGLTDDLDGSDADGIPGTRDDEITNSGGLKLTCDYNQDGVVDENDADVTYYVLPNAVGRSPIGIGIDPLDPKFIWTANQDGTVTRIDSTTSPAAPVTVKVKVGPNPYTYSDFTGAARATITQRVGRAKTIYAGGCADGKNAVWTELSWTADVPLDTKVAFHLRIADQDYDKNGTIDAADAGLAPQVVHQIIDPVSGLPVDRTYWEQSLTSVTDPLAVDKTPIVFNENPVNLTALKLPASAYAQIDIDLISSAEKSPVITSFDLKRTCN